MASTQQHEFDPLTHIEHQRSVNRKFHDTDEKAAEALDACFEAQLGELGLYGDHTEYDEEGSVTTSFKYVKPEAVRVVIDAFMSGKMPQPEGRGSFLFTERTALGRQSALDSAIERIRDHEPYDVTTDPDFYPELGAIDG